MEITKRLLEVITENTGIDVTLRTRKRETVEMRSLYCNVLKDLQPNKTLKSIGDSLNLDHSTVLHSLSKYEMYERFSPELKSMRKRIISNFKEVEEEEIKETKRTYAIIEQISQLLEDTAGTEINFLLQVRLEALYNMNKIKTEGWYDEAKETRMNIIGQNGNDGQHYK
jgi:chlorite dismutase